MRKMCDTCWHWKQDHCGLYSASCEEAVANHQTAPWWLDKETTRAERKERGEPEDG